MWGVLYGSIGLGFFVYGKNQRRAVPLFSGIALMALPYFVDNTYALGGLGAALIALPWMLRA